MRRTVRWARAGYAHYVDRKDETGTERAALFPIVQGSMFRDLRAECASALVETRRRRVRHRRPLRRRSRATSAWKSPKCTVPLLPRNRPRYVMGVGMPEELPQYVARGVDLMDCVLPSRNARNGCLFTSEGRVIIKQARFRDDPAPPDPACCCYTCRTHSRALPAAPVSGRRDAVLHAGYHPQSETLP